MSVDISRLSAGLPPEQQKAVERVYRQQAKDPTTAFLLCFFLGIFGAHCFYLGKTGQGVLRLILSPLIIPGLIWEIVDLFRIDGEVYERNLKLAERLVADAMLAAPPVAAEQEAVRRLDEVIKDEERAQAAAVAAATASVATPALAEALDVPAAAAATAAAPAAAEALAVPAGQEDTGIPAAVAFSSLAEAPSEAPTHFETPAAAAAPEAPTWPVDAAVVAAAATALAAEHTAGAEQQPAGEQERPTAPWPAQEQPWEPMPAAATFGYEEPASAPQWPAPEIGQAAAAEPAEAMAAEQAVAGWGQMGGEAAGAAAVGDAGWLASKAPDAGDEQPAEPAYPWPEARPLSPEPSESSPLWATPPALIAEGGLAATAAAAAAAEALHVQDAGPAESPAPVVPAPAVAAASGAVWPEQDAAGMTWQTPSNADVFAAQTERDAFVAEPGPDDTWATITPEAVAAAALLANQVAPVRRVPAIDATDQSVGAGDPGYVADIGEGGPAGRVHVTIPSVQPIREPYTFDAPAAQEPASPEFVAAPLAAAEEQPSAAPSEPTPYADEGVADLPSAALLFVPVAEAAAASEAAAVPEAAAAGPANAASMYDAAEPAPAAQAEQFETAAPSPEAAASQGGADTAAGGFESHVTEEVHDQGGQAGRRTVKRVRVVRRLTVNGQVQEVSAEQVVDADADTSAAAASLLQTLGTTDLETVARMAGALPEHYVIHKVDQSGGSTAPGPTGQSGQSQQPEQPGQPASGEAEQGGA